MQYFDRSAVSRIIADLELAPTNRVVAEQWLRLWRNGALPQRDTLNPGALKPHLRNLILFDVVPDRRVTVRLAGTTFGFVLGAELTGEDWIAYAPPEYRAERLRIFSDIATGAIGRGVRSIDTRSGEARTCEEILLPFGGVADKDASLVLCHLDWNSGSNFLGIVSREQACGAPLAFETIPLPLLKSA